MTVGRLHKEVSELIEALSKESDLILPTRKEILDRIGQSIRSMLHENGQSSVIFICTHNSRRSQAAELWLRTAADYYCISGISTFSGGTEVTALHPNMAATFSQSGFSLTSDGRSSNPRFTVSAGAGQYTMFSKVYDDPSNPKANFIAVMVCGNADEACPVVNGAAYRFYLPFDDPGAYDGQPDQDDRYRSCFYTIGREMIYLLENLN